MTNRKEPDWLSLLPDSADADNAPWRARASEEWHAIMDELEEMGTFTAGNARMVKTLAIASIRYDMACADLFVSGGSAVAKTPNGEERLRQIHTVMKQLGEEATVLEMELGIPPRRRGSAAKAPTKKRTTSKASLYLIDAKKKPANG